MERKIFPQTGMYIINTGYNELPFFDEGWYGLDKDPAGILFRAASPNAVLRFQGLEGRCRISLLCSARPQHVGEPLRTTVLSDARAEFSITLHTNCWCLREGIIELGRESWVMLQTATPWSPDALYQNGDVRSLGLMVSAIRLIPLPPAAASLWANLQEEA